MGFGSDGIDLELRYWIRIGGRHQQRALGPAPRNLGPVPAGRVIRTRANCLREGGTSGGLQIRQHPGHQRVDRLVGRGGAARISASDCTRGLRLPRQFSTSSRDAECLRIGCGPITERPAESQFSSCAAREPNRPGGRSRSRHTSGRRASVRKPEGLTSPGRRGLRREQPIPDRVRYTRAQCTGDRCAPDNPEHRFACGDRLAVLDKQGRQAHR